MDLRTPQMRRQEQEERLSEQRITRRRPKLAEGQTAIPLARSAAELPRPRLQGPTFEGAGYVAPPVGQAEFERLQAADRGSPHQSGNFFKYRDPFLAGVVQPAAGRAGRAVGENIRVLPGQPAGTTPETREQLGDIGAFAGESLIPTYAWEVALEFAPGIGGTRGLISAVRKQSPEAIRALRAAGVKIGQSEAVERGLKEMASESGALRMARQAEDLGGAVGPEDVKALPDQPIRSAQPSGTAVPGTETGASAALAPETGIPASEATSRLPGQPPVVGGGPPEPPVTMAVEPPDNFDGDVLALTETIRKSKRLRPEQQRAFAAERKIRAGKVGGILEGGRGDEAFQRAQGSLKGEFEGHATFEPPDIPEPRRLRMVEEIRTTDKIRPFEKLNAKQAFDKVMSGRLPEPAELEKLERVFGTEFSQAVLDKAPATWSQLVVDILTAPKALLASFDLSFPLRQGMVLAWSQPGAWLKSWKPMIKAFAREKYAKIADDAMRSDPLFSRYMDSGGYHAPLSGGARAMREESFASHLMDRLPGLGGSQRGFVTFGNKLRFGSWKNLVEGTTAGGEAQDAVDAAFNQFVRHATGRGDVPFRAGEILPGLSAFFSLRNFVSRFQLLTDPLTVKGVPLEVRAKIAGDLAKFFAGGVTFLGLIKMAHDNGVSGFENVTVQHDPRSTDFGKIRIGDRRYDLWTGYAQMARYAAQVMSGKRLAELPDGSLAPVPIDRKKYALRFIESKLDPTLALAIDLWTGETYTGEALKPDPKTLRREAFNRLVPLFIQDLTESLKKYGPLGAAFAAPSLIGAGSSDYPTTEGAKQYAMKQVLPDRLDKLGFPSIERGFSSDYWQKRLPSQTVNPADFDSYSDYRAAYIDHWVEKRPPDMSEALARDLVARKFDALDGIKEFKRQRKEAEIKFWKEHPDLLQQALDSNLEDWSGEKGEILEAVR